MTLGKGLEEVIELGARYHLRSKEALIDHCTDAILQYVMLGFRSEVPDKVENSLSHIIFYTNVIRYVTGLMVYNDGNRAEVETFLEGLGYNRAV